MAKAKLIVPKPQPTGVTLELTIKEGLALRNHLGGLSRGSSYGGTLATVFDTLSSEDVFGPMMG